MSLLDFISPALTVGTEAARAEEQGKVRGSQLLRAMNMQKAQTDHLSAETNSSNARADYYKSRLPNDATTAITRDALIRSGNDPDDIDAALAAAAQGDHSGLKALFTAPKSVNPRILRTPSGYVSVTPGGQGPAAPVLDEECLVVRIRIGTSLLCGRQRR